jgi:hypothetical protein
LGGWAAVRASRRVLELLERQDRARLTHHEPFAVGVERVGCGKFDPPRKLPLDSERDSRFVLRLSLCAGSIGRPRRSADGLDGVR